MLRHNFASEKAGNIIQGKPGNPVFKKSQSDFVLSNSAANHSWGCRLRFVHPWMVRVVGAQSRRRGGWCASGVQSELRAGDRGNYSRGSSVKLGFGENVLNAIKWRNI